MVPGGEIVMSYVFAVIPEIEGHISIDPIFALGLALIVFGIIAAIAGAYPLAAVLVAAGLICFAYLYIDELLALKDSLHPGGLEGEP